ncbi:MAG TPA: hypothetical protein VE870_12785 [Bacteroidales bacterium]|nr:hypothetical protein [Bacteroidales bacterium]
MLKSGLLIIVLIFPGILSAQSLEKQGTERRSANVKLAYNSSVIYPGIRTGIEFPTEIVNLDKARKGDRHPSLKIERFITLNAGWYHHPDFHDNIYPTLGYLIRRTRSNGFMIEFSPEAGLSRTYLGGTTYRVNDSGLVTIEKHAGYTYLLFSIGGGLGYDLKVNYSKPYTLYLKGNLLIMLPYNSTIYLRPALEAGLIFTPGSFLKRSCKIKSKIR